MSGQHNKYERRRLRRYRIRKRVTGSVERPRLSVFRSSRHIYAQIIDDVRGVTLAAASSREDVTREGKGKLGICTEVGKRLAARAKEKGVARVSFDRRRRAGRRPGILGGRRARPG
jgi:large subunit ribosomal protein L18